MGHILGLDIGKTISCSTFRVADASAYQANFTINNAILEVTPPGADCPVVFNVVKGFAQTMTVTNLQIFVVTSGLLIALPDGLYKIKYSINPNTKTYVEYNYYRTCKLRTSYNELKTKLFEEKCSLTKSEFRKRYEDLLWIDFLIKGSEIFGEKGNETKSAELYNEASTRLKSTNYCLTC